MLGLGLGVLLLMLILNRKDRMVRYACAAILVLFSIAVILALRDPEHAPEAIGGATGLLIVGPAIFAGIAYLIRWLRARTVSE